MQIYTHFEGTLAEVPLMHLFHATGIQGRIQDLAMGGGARFLVSYIYERSELRAQRVTSAASYERSEYKSAGGLNLEPLRVNLSVIWQIIIFLLLFY